MPDPEVRIVLLLQGNGKSQVKNWLNSIRDKTTRARVDRQIDKLAAGIGNQKVYKAFRNSRSILDLDIESTMPSSIVRQ